MTVEKESDEINETVKTESQEEIEAMFPQQAIQETKELDPFTSKLLEYELRHIMIKVWQVFPDDPDTEDVKIVTEKFRNEAGDDLRNVIGLNVTKRLLNVHNKLIVKVRFSCRPEKENLLAFLKKYRITGFKRIASATNTFAAQLKNIDDFDKICSMKEITCGKAKISITPCYNFMKKPPHLKTKFVDDTDDEKADEPQEQQKPREEAEIKHKIEVKEEPKLNTTIISQKKEINVAGDQNIEPTLMKCIKENTEIVKPSEPSIKKPASNVIVHKTANKVLNTSATQVIKATAGVNKTTNTKVVPKVQTEKSESKINITKTTKQPNKQVEKSPKATKATNESAKAVAAKVQPKIITPVKKNKFFNRKSVSKEIMQKSIANNIMNKYNDYDEMNDEDIVALLADAVVLDECGTDDE